MELVPNGASINSFDPHSYPGTKGEYILSSQTKTLSASFAWGHSANRARTEF